MNLLHNYKVFTQDDIRRIFELSPSIEEKFYVEKKSKLRYGIIKNFYKDPEGVAAFYENYPLIKKSETALDVDRSVHTNSPGIQGYSGLDVNKSLRHLYKYLHGALKRGGFPHKSKVTKDEIIKGEGRFTTEFDIAFWDVYSNIYWKGMNATTASQIPQFDTFNIGFNIWLSKDVPEGTDFYTYHYKNEKPIFYVQEFVERHQGNDEIIQEFFDYFNNTLESSGHEPDAVLSHDIPLDKRFSEHGIWNQEKNTPKEYRKWFSLPAEYNTCTFYPGIYFHRPSISENFPENLLRYSQVITHAWMTAERFQQSYWSWSQSDSFMKGTCHPKKMLFI